MRSAYVSLATSVNPLQKSVIAEVLRDAGIPFDTYEGPAPAAILGAANPLDYVEFRVPPEQLQEAKDTLCAQGILCDVSERLLKRAVDEIVAPLLENPQQDLDRLVHFIEINNKETVSALFETVMGQDAGAALLEAVFFRMAREGQARLAVLARVLERASVDGFASRFRQEYTAGNRKTRVALLETVAEFPDSLPHWEALAAGLVDKDAEVREAAGESLYALKGNQYRFEPDAPADEREAVAEAILEATRLG